MQGWTRATAEHPQRQWRLMPAMLALVVWLIACSAPSVSETAAPSGSVPPDQWAGCANPEGFAIRYPLGWFVHPPDPGRRVATCMLFAAEPFIANQDEMGRWPGAQVIVTFVSGCRGSFEEVLTERELEVAGFPAFVHDLAVGEGPSAGEPSAYEYFINLSPGRPCDVGESLVVRTEHGAPGSFERNKEVVDQMVTTIRFGG